MALRPKEKQKIMFRQHGTKEMKIGIVKHVLKPEFHRHLKTVQYIVECNGDQLHIEPDEIMEYVIQ
jgi:hypothetical protein